MTNAKKWWQALMLMDNLLSQSKHGISLIGPMDVLVQNGSATCQNGTRCLGEGILVGWCWMLPTSTRVVWDWPLGER